MDAALGEMVVGPLKGHTGLVLCVEFSPDRGKIVLGSNGVWIWDAQTEKNILGPLERNAEFVTFSGDGKLIATWCSGSLVITDVTSGKLKWSVVPPYNSCNVFGFLAFFPGAEKVVGGFIDRSCFVWNVDTGVCVVYELYMEGNLAVDFTSNGTYAAVSPNEKWIVHRHGNAGSQVQVWYSKRAPFTIYLHTDSVYGIRFSSDSRQLLTTDRQSIQVYTLDL